MTTKNPFEIRSDILAMAKDYMDRQFEVNMHFATMTFEKMVETGKITKEEWEKLVPKQYDIAELTKKAEELYSFVTKK
jgi:hypothetical protein